MSNEEAIRSALALVDGVVAGSTESAFSDDSDEDQFELTRCELQERAVGLIDDYANALGSDFAAEQAAVAMLHDVFNESGVNAGLAVLRELLEVALARVESAAAAE